jgi:type IV pilus assembly protein PilV
MPLNLTMLLRPMTTLTKSPVTRPDGFTLVEVLVALLVLSVGLLGLAALQTTGLRFTHQSEQRTQAIIQAYDILDRIRANPVARGTGAYDVVSLGYIAGSYASCLAPGTPCTPAQMATYDISEWNKANARLLSQGLGSISAVAATGIRTVTIEWMEQDVKTTVVVEARL